LPDTWIDFVRVSQSFRGRPEVEFVHSASGVSLFVAVTLLPQPGTRVCHESGGGRDAAVGWALPR